MRKLTHIILFAIVISASYSCIKSESHLKQEAFELEQKALDKILNTYTQIEKYSFVDEYQKMKLITIFKATDTTFKEKDLFIQKKVSSELKEHTKQVKKALESLYAIKKEKKIVTDSILINLDTLLVYFQKKKQENFYKGLLGEKKEITDELIKKLERSINLKRIQNKEQLSNDILFAFNLFWNRDMRESKLNILRSYKNINKRIDTLPEEIFNKKRLIEVLDEPYSDQKILVEMYKVKMKKEFAKSAETFNKDLEGIRNAMVLLIEINHMRFQNDISLSELNKKVKEIRTLLKEKEKRIIEI